MLESFEYGIFFPKLEESVNKLEQDEYSAVEDFIGDWGDYTENKNVKLKKK